VRRAESFGGGTQLAPSAAYGADRVERFRDESVPCCSEVAFASAVDCCEEAVSSFGGASCADLTALSVEPPAGSVLSVETMVRRKSWPIGGRYCGKHGSRWKTVTECGVAGFVAQHASWCAGRRQLVEWLRRHPVRRSAQSRSNQSEGENSG